MRQNKYEYDAFISHAVEDKIPIANELCAKLERAGLKIWYSGKELGVGDSIEKTIERGLNRSRYGIVVFSPTYLAKNWTIREFYTLLAKEIEEQKVILPVLYNITLDDLRNKDLVMADRFAVNSDKGLDFVVERLVREIKKTHVVKRKEAWFSKIWFVLILSLLANVSFLLKDTVFSGREPYSGPSLSFDDRTGSDHADSQLTLLGEMQGLFSRMNTCACNRPKKKDLPARMTSGFAQTVSNRTHTPDYNDDDAPLQFEDEGRSIRRGSKVTMALVFQVEHPAPATSQPVETGEMDGIINSVSLVGEGQNPFVAVSRLDSQVGEHDERCAHHVNLGD